MVEGWRVGAEDELREMAMQLPGDHLELMMGWKSSKVPMFSADGCEGYPHEVPVCICFLLG